MAKPAAKKRKLEPAPHHTRKPRQARLPEMDDPKIDDLHEAALDYAAVRDKRQLLTAEEVDLKATLLTLMKKHDREKYHYNGVTVTLVHEDETVKVKIEKADEE